MPLPLSEGSSREAGGTRKRQISPWTVSLIVVALAACIIIGVYMKLIHDENRKAQNTENVMEVLEANDNSTAQIDEFSTSIQTIKEQANTIVKRTSGLRGSWQGRRPASLL